MRILLINNQIVRESAENCEIKTTIKTNNRSHNLLKLNTNKKLN